MVEPMKETGRWKALHRAGALNRKTLLLIFIAVLIFPTRSYFIQEIRFWLVVLAVLVGLGMLFLAIFILLREAGHRGLHWMKMHAGRIPVARDGRLLLRNAVPRHLLHR
jgi:predicted ferric reductase